MTRLFVLQALAVSSLLWLAVFMAAGWVTL